MKGFQHWKRDQLKARVEALSALLEQFHGSHDQKSHGNWADGGGAVGDEDEIYLSPEEARVVAEASEDIRDEVKDMLSNRRIAEPEMTRIVEDVSKEFGGEPVGLKNRFKEAKGVVSKIFRKAEEKGISADDAADTITDALRYTMQFPAKSYTGGVEAAVARLAKAGFEFIELENNWVKGDAYNGINGVVVHKDTGLKVEIQFQTPESAGVKGITHADFEFVRERRGTSAQRLLAHERMRRVADSIPFPPDITDLCKRLGGVCKDRYKPSRDELFASASASVEFHLEGQHDQSSHGNWATGLGDEGSGSGSGSDDYEPGGQIRVVGDRLVTAKSTAVGANVDLVNGPRMGMDLITEEMLHDKKRGPGLLSRQTAVPGFEDIDISKGNEAAALEEIVRRQTANIVEVADLVMEHAPKTAADTADWYPWANRWTQEIAEENGLSHKAVTAATAALSASAAWDSNVPWAKYLAENLATNKGPDGGINQKVDAKWAVAAYLNELSLGHTPNAEDMAGLVGKRLSELSDREISTMLRGKHDAAGTWNPKTGKFMKGEVRKLGEEYHAGLGEKGAGTVPQSIDNFAKAISVLRDPDPSNEKIDKALGTQNKVRSFYQNMRDPLDTAGVEDVTVDTHHLGIANGMPFTVSSRFLNKQDIINSPGNAKTGALGTYALVVEATRRATEQLNAKHGTNYTPNQIQSIVWEAWKDLYPPRIRSNRQMIDSLEAARSAHALYLRTGGREGISETVMRARIEAARTGAKGPTIEELIKQYTREG